MPTVTEATTDHTADGITNTSQDLEQGSSPSEKFYEADAGDGTFVHEQYLTGIPFFLSFSSLFIALFLTGLDQTIIFTLLEAVGSKFNAYENIGWLASGFLLTLAVFSQTWGKFSILFGRKWSLITALVLFEAGSLMCALANNMDVLIGGRVLAGIGGGGIQTLVFIVGTEMVPINRRAMTFAILGISFSIASIVGPLVGGAFTQKVSWRWCFYINLPLGGVSFFALLIFFNPPAPKFTWKEKFTNIDWVGTFLLTSGCVLLLLAMTFGGVEFPWNSGAVISMFVLGGVVLIFFTYWNFRYSKNQIIPLEVVREWRVDVPVVSLFTCFYCFLGSLVYIAVYFQVIHSAGPIKTGVSLLPFIISVIVASITSGILIKETRYIKPYAIVFGGLSGAVGFGTLSLLRTDSSPAEKIGLFILPGVSMGFMMQCGIMSSQLNAPKVAGSTIMATTLFGFSRALGGAIGSNLSQAIFNATLKQKITEAYNKNPAAFFGFTPADTFKAYGNQALIRSLAAETRQIVFDCVMKAISNVFYTCAAVAVVTFVLTLLYSNNRVPKEEEIKRKEDYEREKTREKEDRELPESKKKSSEQ